MARTDLWTREQMILVLFNVTDGKLYLAPEKRVKIW